MCHELLGERTVEALDGAIHLGAPRVGVVVAYGEILARIVEEVSELTAIVRLYLGDLEGSNGNELCEEVCSRLGRVIGIRAAESELPVYIDGGVDVSLGTVHEPDDRIKLDTSFVLLRSSQLLLYDTSSFSNLSCSCKQGHLSVLWQESSCLEVREYSPRL